MAERSVALDLKTKERQALKGRYILCINPTGIAHNIQYRVYETMNATRLGKIFFDDGRLAFRCIFSPRPRLNN
jgi:hypothetical protein